MKIMKLRVLVVLAAAALAVGSLLSPGLITSAKAEDAPAETDQGLDGWNNVKYVPDGKPPAKIDGYAAEQLARNNGCFRCHAIDRIKTGPPFKSVADAYKDNLQAGEQREYAHLTAGDIFFLNGQIDHHRVLQTDPPNDPVQLKNLIYWIFSLDK